MTTLTALARPATLLAPGSPRRGFLLGFLATLAAGIMIVATASIAVSVMNTGRVMPGVRVAGVEIGGLDRGAAGQRLLAALPSLAEGSVVVEVGGASVEVRFAELGRSYDVDAMISSAYGVARSGDLVSDAVARLRVLAVPASVPVVVSTEGGSGVETVVAQIVDRFEAEASDAAISYEAGEGFAVEEAVTGSQLDVESLRSQLLSSTATTASQVTISVPTQTIRPEITTDEAADAADEANAIAGAPLTLRAGDEAYRIGTARLADLISFEEASGSVSVRLNEQAIGRMVRPLAPAVARAPQDAAYEWGSGGITGVVPAVNGQELDVRASVRAVADVLRERGAGAARRAVPLAVTTSAPALTTQAAQAAAPRMRVLGTWRTDYDPGEGNFWNANIHIPAWDLDGHVVAPGEWFSFWNDIGPVTVERGYGYGGAIIGGRSVPNGALAGGICSTSTTLFNAAMRSGLEIGERINHSYYIERYPVGLDATVFKTDTWVTDMTFRNDTANPVVIRSYTGNGWVRFDIWGVPDGRTVELSDPVTSNHGTAVWTTVVNPSLAPGTSRIVEYPHDGFNAVVTRWVRDADGNLLHQDVWHSTYRTVNGITEVGPRG
ncbi:MAG TPA: VanW family protein [Candidatus Limnocylindria bacterium]|nr:VanW family protein [Candidatus Limnocylindria bacterium]